MKEQTLKKQVDGLVFDMMKIKAGQVAEFQKVIGKPEAVTEFANLLVKSGAVVSVPDEWGDFDTSSANDWIDLPWVVYVRVQNDFVYTLANFTAI